MDEQPRPGILDALEERRGRARARRVGEPNVLSDAATPNVLSTSGGRPASGRPATAEPRRPTRRATRPTDGEPPDRSGVRMPSLVTLIFLAFAALTVVRFIGQFVERIATETPAASSPSPRGAGPIPSTAPGVVFFGTGEGGDCQVEQVATSFVAGTEVWWSAELATEQEPTADALVVLFRDGIEVDREYVPADPSFGSWDTLCASEPVIQATDGTYRLEVWSGLHSVLHAAGEYRLTPP